MIDIMQLAIMWEMKLGQKLFPSYRLEAICQVLDVEIENAHDAMADIEATMKAGAILWKNIFKMEWLAQ